jgi:hypothetical protein
MAESVSRDVEWTSLRKGGATIRSPRLLGTSVTLEPVDELVDGFWWNQAASADFDGPQLAAEEVRIQFASADAELLSNFIDFEEELGGGSLLHHSTGPDRPSWTN